MDQDNAHETKLGLFVILGNLLEFSDIKYFFRTLIFFWGKYSFESKSFANALAAFLNFSDVKIRGALFLSFSFFLADISGGIINFLLKDTDNLGSKWLFVMVATAKILILTNT